MKRNDVKTQAAAAELEIKYSRKNKPGSMAYVVDHLVKSPSAMISIIIIILLFVFSFTSPLILKYGAYDVNMAERFASPSAEHIFGCDELGRDLLARVLYGARYSLSIGFVSTAVSLTIGLILGAAAGYFGRVVDEVIMRVLDIFQAFPSTLLAITIAAILGTGFDKLFIAIGLSGMPAYARMVRASILTVRGNEYVEAARSINCTTLRVILHHVMPNAISPVIVQVVLGIANSALTASGLSFIGFGIQAPTPEWGSMLAASRDFIRDYPHMVIVPGCFIMLSVLCFNLIGDTVRDALDPKLRD